MVRGNDSLVDRFFELSTAMRVSEEIVEVSEVGRTLGANVVVQPFWRKGPRVQAVLEAVDNEWLSPDDDMEQYELLEGSYTLLINLVNRDAIHKGEVWRRFYEAVDVEVGRDRLKGRARSLRGHFCVWRTLQHVGDDMRSTQSSRVRVSNTVKKAWKKQARAPR
jgi:hypothetical protein